ncbi:MAG: HEAT repeat domain-containing protein [Parachlamydiaceae bacterium]
MIFFKHLFLFYCAVLLFSFISLPTKEIKGASSFKAPLNSPLKDCAKLEGADGGAGLTATASPILQEQQTADLLSQTTNALTDDLHRTQFNEGRILFLLHQGEDQQGLKLYQEKFQKLGEHHFDLLHQIGLKILESGFRSQDPECQLLTLFGAAVSAHEDAYYILEENVKNKQPAIQLVAISALARFQNDKADQAIIKGLASSTLEVRYEAAHQLCKKKHPLAVSQTESLMYKTPDLYLPIYPSLFAMIGDPHSTRVLRKLLNHPSKEVRLAAVLSVAKYQRDDLLPQIRQHLCQLQFALQEACASTLGALKDEESIPQLEKLGRSQYPIVALAAHCALYQLGRHSFIKEIEQVAERGNLFAIHALGSIPDQSKMLIELLKNPDLNIRLNAAIALLDQHNPRALESIEEIIIRDKRDLAFKMTQSPGHSFKIWKAIPSSSQLLKDDLQAYVEHIEFKHNLLEKICLLSIPHFITLADHIFSTQQNELVPHTVDILEKLETKEAIACLKRHQQQFGAPLIRQYCNLALYRMGEPGPYAEQLRQWVKTQNKTQLIRFQAFTPWEAGQNSYQLTPEESSKLLIAAFETFTIRQDIQGIEILIEAIATGHKKNKYALAGLLLRGTQ